MALKKEHLAGCVIYRNDPEDGKIKYLVMKKFKGFWEFSKGHADEGENPAETAKRELKEETSLINVSFKSGFEKKLAYVTKNDEGIVVEKNVTYFIGITKQTKIILSDEHLEYRWLGYDEARELVTFNTLKILLDEVNRFLTRK